MYDFDIIVFNKIFTAPFSTYCFVFVYLIRAVVKGGHCAMPYLKNTKN